MSIGFSGIGAGADWNSIINQLLAIEARPLNILRERETTLNAQISEYGKVKSSIDTFMSAMDTMRTGFAAFSGSSTNDSVLTVSPDATAVPASYEVVVSQLADRDKIASSEYTDAYTAVGTGTLSLTVNGETMDLTVDATNNTLAGLRDAINGASDNPGVSASILNTASGSRLILTSDETGADNSVGISIVDGDDASNTDASGLSRLFYIGTGDDEYAEQISSAQNALLTIDGFDISSASNDVTGAIEGVTLNLADTGSATINIARDDEQIIQNVEQFVEAYNTLRDELNQYELGVLQNDSSIRQIEQGLLNILNAPASLDGVDSFLFEAGITRDKNGNLSLDSAELSAAMDTDFDRIMNIFSDSTTGYAERFHSYADSLLEAGGIIEAREDGLDSRMRSLETSIERQELRLEIIEKSLIQQFAALDQTVATLQNTSSYLSSQMSNLVGSN